MLIADRELARKNDQSSAAIRATELLGKELGMFVDRSDNRHRVEKRFSDMTPEEQEIAAEELMVRARAILGTTIDGEAQEVPSSPQEVPEDQTPQDAPP